MSEKLTPEGCKLVAHDTGDGSIYLARECPTCKGVFDLTAM